MGRASLLCVDTNTTTSTKCVNTFVRVNQYPWKSNLPEISQPDGGARFSQPDGATDTLEVTIALGRLPGASKVFFLQVGLFSDIALLLIIFYLTEYRFTIENSGR